MMIRSPRVRRLFRRGGLLRRTLRRRGLEVAVRSALLAGVALASAYVIASSTYEASLLMSVEAEADASGRPSAITPGDLETLARLATSRNVMDDAASDPRLAGLPWSRRAVRTERVPGFPLIRVAARGTLDQAPRIADAVASAIERAVARDSDEARGESRDEAEARLAALHARYEEIERDRLGYARLRAEGEPGGLPGEVALRALAAERLSIRLGIAEAERQKATPPAPGRERVRRLSAAALSPWPVGMAWFWLAAGVIAVGTPSGVLGLAMIFEARRAEAEARELRARGRQEGLPQSPLLVAIQLAHGDWRPHPSS